MKRLLAWLLALLFRPLVRHPKRRGHTALLGAREADGFGSFSPVTHNGNNLRYERFGSAVVDPKIPGDVTYERKVLGVIRFGKDEGQPFARSNRVDVISRGEGPSIRLQQKPVVAQMIIDVRDAHEKNDAAPELFEVNGRVRPMLQESLREIEVASANLASNTPRPA